MSHRIAAACLVDLRIASSDRVLADMEGLMSEYDQIFTQRLFEDHPEKFPEDKYTIEDFMWAWSVIWGRSVDLQYVHHPSGMNFPVSAIPHALIRS
jgi:hypothetical protein